MNNPELLDIQGKLISQW